MTTNLPAQAETLKNHPKRESAWEIQYNHGRGWTYWDMAGDLSIAILQVEIEAVFYGGGYSFRIMPDDSDGEDIWEYDPSRDEWGQTS